jgi:hypothetical protein
MNTTNDMYLHSEDNRPLKERISELETKVESILLILSEVSKAMETTYNYMNNQNKINDKFNDNHARHEKLLTNLCESVDLISNFIPRIKPEAIND